MSGTFLPFATPHTRWRLLWAFRFRDVFTAATIDVPLDVRVPDLRLHAVRGADDGTWRLVYDDGRGLPPAPLGAPNDVPVVVIDPSGSYMNHDSITVPRVHPAIGHPPPLLRTDFLRVLPLWPTRRAPISSSETVVVGRLFDAAQRPLSNRRVFIASNVGNATPFAVSDGAGEFVVRLPALLRVPGTTSAQLQVAVTSGGAPVAIASLSPAGNAPDRIQIPIGVQTLVSVQAA